MESHTEGANGTPNGFYCSFSSDSDDEFSLNDVKIPDMSVVATCEYCSREGPRHTFYSKSKRFCTMGCSRSFSASRKDRKPPSIPRVSIGKKGKGQRGQARKSSNGTSARKDSTEEKTFDLDEFLSTHNVQAAPVACFKHCVLCDAWDHVSIGMKVEVINKLCGAPIQAYWIATVIRLAGYKVLLRYEGFGNDNSHDFWTNLCHQEIHAVGYCARNTKPLVPPQAIESKYADWKDYLVKRLIGARTLPEDFYNTVMQAFDKHPMKRDMLVEVVDKDCVSAMRVATIHDITGCRLHLKYHESKGPMDEFWCHRASPLIHSIGWSQLVGHKINASTEYKADSFKKIVMKKFSPQDTTPEMFPKILEPPGGSFQVGMKLETVDPLNLSTICVATVRKVLRNNYLMIGIDGSLATDGSDWFCYHATSTSLFPVGFCEINGLALTPPRGYKGQFRWVDYLKEQKATAAPVRLFQRDIPKHGFRVNMKVEAVDLMEPRLICIGTIVRVVGRLLRIHFDGWDESYDQWVDCESVDIYPVGYCDLLDYLLEGPKTNAVPTPTGSTAEFAVQKKRKPRPSSTHKPRKYMRVGKPSAAVAAAGTTPTTAGSLPISSATITHNATSPHRNNHHTLHNGINHHTTSSPTATSVHSTTSAGHASPVTASATSTVHTAADSASAMGVSSPRAGNSVPTVMSPTVPTPSSTTTNTPPPPAAPGSQAPLTGPATTGAAARPTPRQVISHPSQHPLHVTHNAPSTATSSSGLSVQLHHVNPSSLPHSTSSTSTGSAATTPEVQHRIITENIPRIVPGEPDGEVLVTGSKDRRISPQLWGPMDVCQFLRINDCGQHCDSFARKNIDGNQLLMLSKEQIVNLTGMKVGPSLKIHSLLNILRSIITQQQKQQQRHQLQQQHSSQLQQVLMKSPGPKAPHNT